RPEEDVAQEVLFAVSIEPSCEQSGRFRVPTTRAPCAIEYVGGTIDRIDAGQHRLRWIIPVARPLGIALAGNFKQIAALGARQAQSAGKARKCRSRDGHIAPLLDKRVPGDAQSAELSDLLAPQAGRAPSWSSGETEFCRRLALAERPQERAERESRSDRVLSFHGGLYTKITRILKPVPRTC